MTAEENLRELVETAVAEAFDEHVRALHDTVVARVMKAAIAAANASKPVSEWLKQSTEALENSGQQTDILKALLDGAARFAGRAALFVLRGNAGVLWQARGFSDDAIRGSSLDTGSGPCGAAVQQRIAISGPASDINGRLASSCAQDLCAVVPLVIRDKVAAVVYADGGPDGAEVDLCALELLVRAAGNWIELAALRKAAGATPAPRAAAAAASGFSASHNVGVATAGRPAGEPPATTAAPVASESQSPSVAATSIIGAQVAETLTQTASYGSGTVEATSATAAGRYPGEEDLHKKARRFAKLLVDEIVLYNRDKVEEGRRQRDLYDRLKDDIDKSRATYEKRYAQTSVVGCDYFRQAVVAGLADHNSALLGSNFPG